MMDFTTTNCTIDELNCLYGSQHNIDNIYHSGDTKVIPSSYRLILYLRVNNYSSQRIDVHNATITMPNYRYRAKKDSFRNSTKLLMIGDGTCSTQDRAL